MIVKMCLCFGVSNFAVQKIFVALQIYKTNPTQMHKPLVLLLAAKTPEDLWLQSLEKTLHGVPTHFTEHIITLLFIITVIASGIASFP